MLNRIGLAGLAILYKCDWKMIEGVGKLRPSNIIRYSGK
jgi:hypothetical protein